MATIGTTTLTSILQSYQIQIQKTESKVREIENNIRKLEDEIDFVSVFRIKNKIVLFMKPQQRAIAGKSYRAFGIIP